MIKISPPYSVQFEEFGGTDCATPEFHVLDANKKLVFAVELLNFVETRRERNELKPKIERFVRDLVFLMNTEELKLK